MVLGGQYGRTSQIIRPEGGTTVLHSIYSQFQFLTNTQSNQLLAEITAV